MAWANSKIFSAMIRDALNRTTAFDLDNDTITVALYNNTTAPDQTVSLANSAYPVGQWVVGNEVSQAVQWPAGGVNLASVTSTFSSNVYTFTAANTASGSAATLSNVYGCLVYDSTLAGKYGLCFNYFGGANSVVNGTFTIVWSGSGIFALTL